jgi:hypothetical protein
LLPYCGLCTGKGVGQQIIFGGRISDLGPKLDGFDGV